MPAKTGHLSFLAQAKHRPAYNHLGDVEGTAYLGIAGEGGALQATHGSPLAHHGRARLACLLGRRADVRRHRAAARYTPPPAYCARQAPSFRAARRCAKTSPAPLSLLGGVLFSRLACRLVASPATSTAAPSPQSLDDLWVPFRTASGKARSGRHGGNMGAAGRGRRYLAS